jgi:hypothetical protein
MPGIYIRQFNRKPSPIALSPLLRASFFLSSTNAHYQFLTLAKFSSIYLYDRLLLSSVSATALFYHFRESLIMKGIALVSLLSVALAHPTGLVSLPFFQDHTYPNHQTTIVVGYRCLLHQPREH